MIRISFGQSIFRLAAVATIVASSPASAQSLALNRFHPAMAGDRFLGIQSPYVVGHLQPSASALFEYADSPLVLRKLTDKTTVEPIVAQQAFLHLNASASLRDRVLVNVDVPIAVMQSGNDPAGFHAADLGDIRVGARARLSGANNGPLQVAVGGFVFLPTGTGNYVTDGKTRALLPQLIVGGLVQSVVWSASAGTELRVAQEYQGVVPQGSAFTMGAGVAKILGAERQGQIGIEGFFSAPFREPEARNTNAEVLLHAKYRFSRRYEITVGIGPGIGVGLGTPTFRALLSFAYAPNPPIIPPEPEKETLLDSTKKNDADKSDADKSDEAALAAKPATSGTPRVEVLQDEIILGEDILFDTGQATIQKQSEKILDEVADTLVKHSEIRRVEVRGHTDFRGTLARNMLLGEQRAQAVRNALLRRSVNPERLIAKGYGPNEPVAPNTTAEGRKKNRRVEFKIVERDKQEAPKEQPVEQHVDAQTQPSGQGTAPEKPAPEKNDPEKPQTQEPAQPAEQAPAQEQAPSQNDETKPQEK